MKRTRPIQRGGRLRSHDRMAKRAAKRERNFGIEGGEADRVRAMPCLCAKHSADWYFYDLERCHAAGEPDAFEHNDPERPSCSGDVVAAHVTARGMGGAKGGRFDIVPLCDGHHGEAGEADSFDAMEMAKLLTAEQVGEWFETPSGGQWSVDPLGFGQELSPVGRAAFAIRRGETNRSAFEQLCGLDLRAEADRIALGHPDGLGIRGLERQWARMTRVEAERPAMAATMALEGYDLEALLGWVRRWADGRGPTEHDPPGAEDPRDLLATDLADDLHIEDDAAFALLHEAGAFEGLPS